MNTDRSCWIVVAGLALLGGCATDQFGMEKAASTFGEANQQTMMAQVVDPDPQYDSLIPETSAAHAAQAIDRYKRDAVKKPDRVSSTTTTSGTR